MFTYDLQRMHFEILNLVNHYQMKCIELFLFTIERMS